MVRLACERQEHHGMHANSSSVYMLSVISMSSYCPMQKPSWAH